MPLPPSLPARPTPAGALVPAATVQAEQEAAHAFALNEKASATRRAYGSDFAIFATWCRARGAEPLPALPEVVATFLASQAQAGVRPSTLGRRLAAIAYAHKLRGITELPTTSETVKATMRGIRRTVGSAKTKKAAATAEVLERLLATIQADTLTGRRDRALLVLGFAGAFRRSELVALRVEDLAETPKGLRVIVRRSKTDQEGTGQVVAIPHGARLYPVATLREWLAAAGITAGPIFRPIAKGSRILDMPLSAHAVAKLVKRAADAAGLDARQFSGHSLRAGFLTSAAERGAKPARMMAVSRHKSLDVLMGYVRPVEAFEDHAGVGFL